MNITKKFDRAFQWAGEKMGSESKTSMTEDFRLLEMEMALRFDGMDRLQKSMNAYVKWLGRRNEAFEDKEKGLPVSYLARTMINHGEDFDSESEFGNCLIAMGRANERIAGAQDQFVADATTLWLESLERSLAMMKDYQAARKKLENRRLAYDASLGKMQKARRDDFRIEEEVRASKAKYEETSEDVARRMQDIKDAEVESVRDLSAFLDAELDYHERCAEELRRTREQWAGRVTSSPVRCSGGGGGYAQGYGQGHGTLERRPTGRSRSNTAQSFSERLSRTNTNGTSGTNGTNSSSGREGRDGYAYEDHEPAPPVRMPIRSASRLSVSSLGNPGPDVPVLPVRPSICRSNTFQAGASSDRFVNTSAPVSARGSGASTPNGYHGGGGSVLPGNVGSLRGQLRPVSRIVTSREESNVFADGAADDETASSGGGSPEWGHRSASPATSFGSTTRSTTSTSMGARKAPPPPPPPSRAKKPAPPIPAKREQLY